MLAPLADRTGWHTSNRCDPVRLFSISRSGRLFSDFSTYLRVSSLWSDMLSGLGWFLLSPGVYSDQVQLQALPLHLHVLPGQEAAAVLEAVRYLPASLQPAQVEVITRPVVQLDLDPWTPLCTWTWQNLH